MKPHQSAGYALPQNFIIGFVKITWDLLVVSGDPDPWIPGRVRPLTKLME